MAFQKGKTMYAYALKMIRNYHSLTQLQLAAIAGINPPQLSAIERGKKLPQLHTLQRYADWLNVPLSSLIRFAEVLEDPSGLTPVMHPKLVRILDWALEVSEF